MTMFSYFIHGRIEVANEMNRIISKNAVTKNVFDSILRPRVKLVILTYLL